MTLIYSKTARQSTNHSYFSAFTIFIFDARHAGYNPASTDMTIGNVKLKIMSSTEKIGGDGAVDAPGPPPPPKPLPPPPKESDPPIAYAKMNPNPVPKIPPTTPVIAASVRNMLMICAPLNPNALSIPISLVLSITATYIVLVIPIAATNSTTLPILPRKTVSWLVTADMLLAIDPALIMLI